MSQNVEVNALNNGNNGNVRRDGLDARGTAVSGRPVFWAQRSNQPRTSEPYRLRRPTMMMPPAFGYQAGPSAGPQRQKVVNYFHQKEVQLNTCKNAWVPPCLKAKAVNDDSQRLSDEDVQIEGIRKKFMSILNKISPENMKILGGSIASLPIKTEKCLRKVIEILFQKALDEPNFTPQYAYLCMAMHEKEVNDDGSETSFKQLLTTCCKDRFYQMRVHQETLAESLKAMEDCNDQDVKKEMRSKYDQDEMAYRKRSVGNCRFMCELYKVRILTSQMLEMSMEYLLNSPSEETLECACNILKHTGKAFSHAATFEKLNAYTRAEYKTVVPSRIRFMIMDTMELMEKNHWVPRRAGPKEVFCNWRAPRSTAAPAVHRQQEPVQRQPHAPQHVTSTKNAPQKPDVVELLRTKPPTEVRKVDVTQISESAKAKEASNIKLQLPLPASSSNIVKSDKSLEIQKKCRSILDNITSENVVQLANSMVALPIKTGDCLKTVVEQLFQKAMEEPTLTPECAYICSSMRNIEVQTGDQKKTSFTSLLTAMCKNAFDSMESRKRLVAKDRSEIESCKDKATKKQLQSKFDQNELDYRRRCVANCRFICELVKVDILVPPILEMCVAKLAESKKETSVECVGIMVKHAGKALNHVDLPQINKSAKAEETSDLKVQPSLPESSSDVVNKSLEIHEKCRSIFDNITSENMVQLADSMVSLPITTGDCLKNVVELLFQKAMEKPALTPEYAYVCWLMRNTKVQTGDQKISFTLLLIAMCKNAFDSMDTRKRLVAKDRCEIESCKDKETRKQLQSKFDQDELDYRRRCVANCRFMCELEKVDILVPPIIEMCAAKLAESQKETSIECACVMLKHAGKTLNHSGVFEKLHEYATAKKQKFPSRILSMILDTTQAPNGNDSSLRKPGEKPPLVVDDTEDCKCTAESPEQPSTDVRPVMSVVLESTPPEKLLCQEGEKDRVQNKPAPDAQKPSVYKTVKSVINSVTAENTNSTIKELSAHITNVDVMEKTVDFIFARAKVRPESIPELVCICSSLKNIVARPADEHAKPISFKKQVLARSVQALKSGVDNDSSGNGFTHKEPFAFVGELFNAHVLSAHTLLEFVQIIPDKLTNRGLDNTCCLLKTAGKKLERVHNLKKTIRKLTDMGSNDAEGTYSRRSSELLKELVELRDNKWVS